MKRLIAPLLLLAAVAAPAVLRAADFEGKVRMKMIAGQKSSPAHTIDYAVKAGLVRTEIGDAKGPGGIMIMNLPQREMTMLMPQQHMYMVHPLPAAAPGANGGEAADQETTFTATGEKEKILGYDCTKYVVTSKHGSTDLWLTEQLGSFSAMTPPPGPGGARGGAMPPWAKALEGKNFFPLRIVTHDPSGAEEMRMEVESVEPQSLPDSLFTPPADYRKLDMGGMMRGLGGMRP